jgi:hypothetical protein
MAEITRWSTMKSTRLFSTRDPGSEQVELRERVIVRSLTTQRLDVAVLRDLVAALDEAQVPDRTAVTAVLADGRVTQLIVEAELDPGPPAAVDGSAEEPR